MSIKSIFRVSFVVFLPFLFGTVAVSSVSAATVVGGRVTGTIMWDAAHSPYLLDSSLTFSRGSVLHIGPGVQVLSGLPVSDSTQQAPYIPGIEVLGRLEIDGTSSSSVVFRGLSSIVISEGDVAAHDVEFLNMRTGLSLVGSTARVDRATFTDDEIGIASSYPVYLAGGSSNWGTGGIGNALSDVSESNVVIRDTSFVGNKEYDILNMTKEMIDARNNAWENDLPKIYGPVDTSGTTTATTTTTIGASSSRCCSNVLFLPGIQASRLYVDEGKIGQSKQSENRLWEPNRNDDARKLFRSSTSSVVGVYTKDIVDNAFGYTIYGDFIKKMNDEVSSGRIHEWKAYPYDWRDSVDDVAQLGSLMSMFSELASSSPTGKVTIIAHSNGGLLAKAFGKVLTERGLSGMVDRVVFVAVPQLGTPQAIGALLHGDSQSILGGLLLSSGVARHLGLSIAGAYGLVPSESLISKTIGDIVSFATSTIASFDFSKYGTGVSHKLDLDDFLTARRDGRSQPAEDQVGLPAVLDPFLLSRARRVHDELDEWHFASTTDVYSLAGWGRPTTEALQYEEREGSLIGGCIKHILMTPRNSLLGDGTVLSQSAAAYSAGHTLFVNLDAKHEDAVHSNILGSASVLNALSTIISMSSSTDILANLYSIPNISDHIPQEYTQMRSLRIGVHSPVDIHVYDAKGNHTGRARNPIPDSDLDFVEEKIPGGSYSIIGEDKYVSIEGVTPGDVYTVNVRGTGEGTFDLDIDESLGDMIVATSSFRSVPVTVGMSATTSVRVGGISRGKLSVGDLLRVDEQGVNLMRSENTVMVEDSKKEMASRRSRSRASSTLLVSEPSPAAMDVNMNDHVNRIVDLMKKNKRFLSSLSVGDRAFLLDILQML